MPLAGRVRPCGDLALSGQVLILNGRVRAPDCIDILLVDVGITKHSHACSPTPGTRLRLDNVAEDLADETERVADEFRPDYD